MFDIGFPELLLIAIVGLLVLCAAAGMGFGAMNEVIEFAATILVMP